MCSDLRVTYNGVPLGQDLQAGGHKRIKEISPSKSRRDFVANFLEAVETWYFT